jgi:UDP-glucose 4-epimerase
MDEEHPLAPVSPYGISKLAAEQYVRLYARDRGLPALTVRPFSLYGPGQRKLVVHDLMLRLLEGERPLTVAGRGDVTRDLVYVEDAARAVVQLARAAPAAGEAYNLSSGRGTRLDELAAVIAGLDGNGVEIAFTGELRAGDPLHWQGDPGRAAALGATCATDLAEGLRRTYAWVRAEIASR